jgi:Fe2+ transport system protein FeoA
MTLNSLPEGKSATITAVNADKELRNRFNSFGVVKGATVYAERYTLAKQTMEIRINKTHMALRLSEASKVQISK